MVNAVRIDESGPTATVELPVLLRQPGLFDAA